MSFTPRFHETDAASNELQQEVERLRTENAELRRRLGLQANDSPGNGWSKAARPPAQTQRLPFLTAESASAEKIAWFRNLFRGRDDVYPVYWISQRTGKKGYSPAVEDPWNAFKGAPKKYLPLNDRTIHDHLIGDQVIGCYPLLKDNTCWFLACDFDKDGWVLDSLAYIDCCKRFGAPAYLERSRSGQGGHVWIFFAAPVAAISARQLGLRLLRETMNVRAELDLASYDRFFPNQDFVPSGGFGNLIALPLQKKARAFGNTEFIDPDDPELRPYPDQWDFLSRVDRVMPAALEALLEKVPALTIGAPFETKLTPFVRHRYPAPKQLHCTLEARVSMEKSGMPPWMLAQLKHLATFHNPKFYERQKLRLSTYQTPRLITCYEEDIFHIHLPRGLLAEIRQVAENAGSKLSVTDQRSTHEPLSFQFRGTLTPAQEKAVQKVLAHEMGVLVAPPGAGKTVMGCYVVAKRNLPTLILAHRKPILEQWRIQLSSLLGLTSREIGQEGAGRSRLSGIVDLAMIQSLTGIDDIESFFARYGLIVVDECHHLPAFSFESCIKKASACYFLGLTATPYRRDGLQDIITMQCGPIRCTIDDSPSDMSLKLIVRETSLVPSNIETASIQDTFRDLVKDDARNVLIEEDVVSALTRARQCLILTQRKEHCRLLAERLIQRGKSPVVLNGEVGKRERAAIIEKIQNAPAETELLVIATGEYLGEGFDCPRIDTLFLTFPISFKGKIVQYVGRALRSYPGKRSVEVFDYIDTKVPVLSRMFSRRQKTYKALGFDSQTGKNSNLLL